MRINRMCTTTAVALLWGIANVLAWGQATEAVPSVTPADDAANAELYRQFSELLSPGVLEGSFTVDGKPAELQQELYELRSVSKLPNADDWLFKARIRYGDHDVTVPLPLEVKWAGQTPVITVNELTIPGLGTFNARVVIAAGKYAGTWQHGDVGGHMFGRISKPQPPADAVQESR